VSFQNPNIRNVELYSLSPSDLYLCICMILPSWYLYFPNKVQIHAGHKKHLISRNK
jgi:hypothetical protein